MSTLQLEQRRLLGEARILIVDLGHTCGHGVTVDTQEIIEIGYCVLDAKEGIGPAGSIFVRPMRSPVTPNCERFTGVTAQQLADKPGFLDVVPDLRRIALESGAACWTSWGHDQKMLARQCKALGVENPFAELRHYNARKLLTPVVYEVARKLRDLGKGGGVSLAVALRVLNLHPEGRAHGEAAGARNAARLLETLRVSLGIGAR